DAAQERPTAEARVRALNDGLKLVLKLRRDEEECEIGNRPGKWCQGSAKRIFGRREARASRRDPSADAKRGESGGHALSLSRSVQCRGPERKGAQPERAPFLLMA